MTDEDLTKIREILKRRQTTTDDYRRTWDTDYLINSAIATLLEEVERLKAKIGQLEWDTGEARYWLEKEEPEFAQALSDAKEREQHLRETNTVQAEAMMLLAEKANRAEAQNATMRDIVQQVAKGPTILGIGTMYLCNFCDVYVGGIFGRTDHRANCPVTKARAILAQQPE